MKESSDTKKLVIGTITLAIAIVFFGGFLQNTYGGIFDSGQFPEWFKTGSGTSAKGGFLFALSLAPAVMLALGFVAIFEKYHALYAASRLLTPVLKPLIGIPGCCSISLIASTQSTDAGSSTAKFLRQDGLISHKELLIFAAFQFSAGAMITNFLSSFAPVLLVTDKAGNTAPATIAMVLGIVFVFMTENKLITDVFVEGARKGWDIAVKNTIPNVLMAFVIIHILKVSGALSVIGKFLGFIMLPLGLPGESIAVFMAAFLSWGGSAGVLVALGR